LIIVVEDQVKSPNYIIVQVLKYGVKDNIIFSGQKINELHVYFSHIDFALQRKPEDIKLVIKTTT